MASDAGPLGPLTVASSSGFQQTGSWDMVNMAKIPITATLGALSRYAAGRVNPYTPLVGQTMCKALFRMKQQERANMKQALSRLPCCSTLGSTLYIGFGIENLVRIMGTTEEGTLCLALCAALVDCISLPIASEVLLEMARGCSIDEKYLPSNSEWEALLKSCAGILTATVFPLKCEGFMRLSQSGQILKFMGGNRHESLTEALLGISKVTRGEMAAITITGGPDTGWLGAVAEWIFSLDVTIIRSSGDILYSNHQNNTAQVTIIFGSGEEGLERCLQIDSRTYVLKDASPMIFAHVFGESVDTHQGRVAWKTALSEVFGTDFKTLVGTAAFGAAVGSAARITQAMTKAEEGIPPFVMFKGHEASPKSVKNPFYGIRSYGRGFVDNSIEWFPELEHCRGDMETHAGLTLTEAISIYIQSIQALGKQYDCSWCQQDSTVGSDATRSNNTDRDVESDTMKVPVYCLVRLLETIIRTSRLLSCCDVQENLCLSPVGLEYAYHRCEQGRDMVLQPDGTFVLGGSEEAKELACLTSCLGSARCSISEFGVWSRPLAPVIELFSGISEEYMPPRISASSSSGVCVYLDILTNASANSKSIDRIHVVTGNIELDGKSHAYLSDQLCTGQKRDVRLEAVAICASEATFRPPVLRVTERAIGTECSFYCPSTMKSYLSASTIGPATLASTLTTSRRLVQCSY